MTRARRPRSGTEHDAIAAIKAGTPIDWSPEAWSALVNARYFHDPDLTADEEERAAELLRAWRKRQYAHEKATRGK